MNRADKDYCGFSLAKEEFLSMQNKFNMLVSLLLLAILFIAGGVLVADAIAVGESEVVSVFEGFASYGFGGLMTLALGYALVGLYNGHKEERQKWLEAMEKHFDRLICQLKENDDSRAKLAQEIKDYLHTHENLNRDLRDLIERLKIILEAESKK